MKSRATEIMTLFTTDLGQSHLFLSADTWTRVKLRLETAGPVAVSTRTDIAPVLGGGGALLGRDELEFILQRGEKLYYIAQAINRVRAVIEPLPTIEVVPTKAVDETVPGVPAPMAPAPQPQPARPRRPRWP